MVSFWKDNMKGHLKFMSTCEIAPSSLSLFHQSHGFYRSDRRRTDEDLFCSMLWADEIYPVGPMKQNYRAADCLLKVNTGMPLVVCKIGSGMAWCQQASSHYLNQCWPRFMLPYGVARPQWVNWPALGDSIWILVKAFMVHWVGIKELTDHYLNQCWLIVNWNRSLWSSEVWTTAIFIQE